MSAVITKADLAAKYGISRETLRVLLNEKYYLQLSEVGYEKNSRLISPKVLNKFIEIYGEA